MEGRGEPRLYGLHADLDMIRSRRSSAALFTTTVFLSVLLIACATQGPLTDPHVNQRKGFRVQVPRAGWEFADSDGADLTLRDTRSSATMAVSASCPGETGPLPSLVRHLFFGLRDVRQLRHGSITLDGAAGVDTMVTGRLDGVPVQVRSVVIRRNGCLYDLLFLAHPDTFGSQSETFDAFLRGWQFL